MKTKNTVFLLVVALGIGGAIFYLNQKEDEIITSAAIPLQSLSGVTSGTVQKIHIEGAGTKPVTITRSGDQWYTNVDQKYVADQSAVQGVLEAIDEPIEAKIVSSNPDSHGQYHVNDTSGTKVQVFAEGKDKPAIDIVVGKDGPNPFSTYVRRADSEDVLNAQASLSMVFKRPDGWRQKQIFDFPGANSTRIEASGTSQTFTLAKSNDTWMFEAPEKAEADSARVTSLANMLSSLRANEFIDPATGQQLSDFGLEPPRQTLTLSYEDKSTSPSASKALTLYIGKEANTPGDWYAKRQDKNDIFTIGGHVTEALLPDPASIIVAKPALEAATTATEASLSTVTNEADATETSSPADVTPVPVAEPEQISAPSPVSTLEATQEATPAATPEAIPASTPEVANDAAETTAPTQ